MIDSTSQEHIDNFIDMQKRGARVVSGNVIGGGGKGAVYTLDNNEVFKFNREECKELSKQEYPIWKI